MAKPDLHHPRLLNVQPISRVRKLLSAISICVLTHPHIGLQEYHSNPVVEPNSSRLVSNKTATKTHRANFFSAPFDLFPLLLFTEGLRPRGGPREVLPESPPALTTSECAYLHLLPNSQDGSFCHLAQA